MKTQTVMIFVALALLAFGFQSCNSNQNEGDERIVGVWKIVEHIAPQTEETSHKGKDIRGFEFFLDGSCDNKSGYFMLNEMDEPTSMFLGTNTNYEVKNDTLRIFNLATGAWDSHNISRVVQDTLLLQYGNNVFDKFVRVEKHVGKRPSFDKIILSTESGKDGSPIYDVAISRNGDFFFNGTSNNTKTGLYTSELDTSYFNQIERAFQNIDIDNMENFYLSEVIDNYEETQLLFIRNGRMYKSIIDYGNSSPAELQWACNSLKQLYQQVMLNLYKPRNSYLKSANINMSKGKERLYLNKAETTYLKSLLSEAKELKIPFVKMYVFNVVMPSGQIVTASSDGRYYTIGPKTYDIGHNFISTNNLRERFEAKAE